VLFVGFEFEGFWLLRVCWVSFFLWAVSFFSF
jgi:hypothetical protein